MKANRPTRHIRTSYNGFSRIKFLSSQSKKNCLYCQRMQNRQHRQNSHE